MSSVYADRITRLSEDNRMFEAQNKHLRSVVEKQRKEIEGLKNDIFKLREDKFFARIKKLDEEINKNKAVLNGVLPISNMGDYIEECIAAALKEKIERLELEKARLRVEG